MIRKILSAVIGTSIALSPVSQAFSQDFIYRYKRPVNFSEPAPGEAIGVGNDIIAFYTAPVGYDFSKRIPVKTKDVEAWVIDEGDLPSGISLDSGAGVHIGEPEVEQKVVHRLSGYDGANNRIAKAEVHFDIREPQGISVPVRFLAHVGQYSYNVIPSPPEIAVDRWEQWMVMPDGFAQRNEALEGVATAPGVHTLLWQGYDYLNRPVAFAHGDLVVTEGPRIDDIADQRTNPARNQPFRIQAAAHDVISTAVYRLILVDGTRPEGLEFDAETGLLSGLVKDFDWKATFKIQVTDTYDRLSAESNEFVLSTVPASFSMDEVRDLVAIKGENRAFGFDVKSTVPGLTWSLAPESAPLPPGMSIEPDDQFGFIRGVPRELGEWPGIILMASAPGFEKKTQPFKITVREQNVVTRIPAYQTRVGHDVETSGIAILRGRADPVTFEFTDPSAVPPDMTIDADTGVIKRTGGYPAVGGYVIGVTIKNGDGEDYSVTQRIQVYPSIDVAYPVSDFVRFDAAARADAQIDRQNIVGTPTFSIEPSLPVGLAIQPRSGRIQPVYGETIPKSAIGAAQYVVTMTDDTGIPVVSDPFPLEIKERPDLAVSEGVIEIERYTGYNQYHAVRPAAVEHAYPIGSARYTYTGSLPEGIELDPYGYFRGSTKDAAGDFSGITVTVTDGDGQTKSYGPMTIKLVQAKPLQELTVEDKPETWVAGRPFSFQVQGPANGRKPFKWVLTDAPAGVAVSSDGILSGTIPLEGEYAIHFDVSDDTARDAVEGVFNLTVEEPFEFKKADFSAYKNTRFTYPEGEVEVERGIRPFTWRVLPSTQFPASGGWGFSSGWLYGTPASSSGGFQLEVEMTDKAGVKKQFSTFLKFNPPAPFSVDYPASTLSVGSAKGLPLVPKPSDKTVVVSGWVPVSGLPSGISFDTLTGSFSGSPYPAEGTAGIHTISVTPNTADPDVKLASPSFPVTLKIGYTGEIDFRSQRFKHRVGADIRQTLSYSKAVSPVRFTAVSTGDGVSFDPATATFTAKFAEPGLYTAGSVKIEENDDPAFNREKTSGFGFEIVPDIALTVPATMTFGQFDLKSVAITEVLNVIGDGDDKTPDVTYGPADGYAALPAGLSVNALTGAVEGTPQVFGDFGPFAITAFDAYGDRKNSNEFSLKIAERQQLAVSYPQGFAHFRRYGTHASAPTPVNGYGPYTWSIDRTPPSGITFDPDTGSFRASSDGIVEPQTFTVTVVDSKGGPKGTATATVTVGIAERPQLSVRYDSPVTFTRHIADLGRDPQRSGTVQRGGALEFTVEAAGGGDALASCIGFDAETGRFSTDPACKAEVAQGDYRVTVTDATWRNDGNANGRAEVTVKVGVKARPAIKLAYPDYDKAAKTFGFQRHLVKTVRPEWDNPIDDEVTWSIAPTPPAGIVFNEDDGSITVDTPDLIADADYVVTIEDDFDGSAKFPMVLGVGERKQLAFSLDHTAIQEIELNGRYSLTLDVENVIADGDATTQDVFYGVRAGILPRGIEFDADGSGPCGAAGTFCGTADVLDHNRTFPVTVRATDAFDGIVERTFTLKVVEDATPMKVTYAEPGKARVGYAWSLAAPRVEFAVGNFAFAAPSLAQYGLSIDAKTGLISGRPNTTFDMSFDITVTDKLGAARAVTVPVRIVSVPSPTVTVPNPVSILFNRDIPEDQQRSPDGIEPSGSTGFWTLDPTTPPPGLTFDPLTGQFGGRAADIGVYGPYTLTLRDTLPGSFPSVFSFDIAMNEDPIELEELSVLTKVGYPFETKAPEYDNNYKAARFLSPELNALGLSVDPVTGIVSGSIREVMDVKPNLVIRDATIRTTSKPVNIRVLPRLRLTAPETIYMTAFETVSPKPSVTPAFQAGTVTWEDIDPDFLPVGVVYDTDGTKGCGAPATFCGAPRKAESLGPFTLAATDTFGASQTDRAVSNPITIVVRKGLFAMEFLPNQMSGELPEATKRTAYTHNLVDTGMFTYEGMDLSTIVFSMAADPLIGEALPPGLTVQKNGIISGTPLDEGTYTFNIVAKYSNKPEVRGKFTIKTKRPDTEFDLAERSFPKIEKLSSFSFDFKSILKHVNIPLADVVWGQPVALPNWEEPARTLALPDLTMSSTGVLSGVPTGLGKFRFSITVSYTHRQEVYFDTAVYDIEITGKEYKFKEVETAEFYSSSYTCGINMDDEAMCWGENYYGVLGTRAIPLGSKTAEPQKVALTAKVKKLESGGSQVCAQTVDDRLACWGSGYYGGSSSIQSALPTYVMNNVRQFSVGEFSACAVDKSNEVWCWGNNVDYVLGRSGSGTNLAKVTSLGNSVEAVSVGARTACALSVGGEVKCWGNLSWRTYDLKTFNPATIQTTGAAAISMGNNGLFVLQSSGSVTAHNGTAPRIDAGSGRAIDNPTRNQPNRGNPNCVQVSDDTLACAVSPITGLAVANLRYVFPGKLAAFSIGTRHFCGIVEGGATYCAGSNYYGELGVPMTTTSSNQLLEVVGN